MVPKGVWIYRQKTSILKDISPEIHTTYKGNQDKYIHAKSEVLHCKVWVTFFFFKVLKSGENQHIFENMKI